MLRLLVALAVVAATYAVAVGPAATYSGGAPTGFAGDFTDPDGSPLACTACHTAFALGSGDGGVEVEAPAVVAPGETARITVTVDNQTDAASEGSRLQGFQATVKDPATGRPVGRITLIEAGTKYAGVGAPGDTVYVTHAPGGTAQTSWSFDWTAPTAGASPTVRLYVAANAANGDGESSGDHIYATTVDLATASVAAEPPASAPTFDLAAPYPNPVAGDRAAADLTLQAPGAVDVALVDGLGRRVRVIASGDFGAGRHRVEVGVDGLGPGTYFVVVDGPGGRRARPLVVGR